MCVRNETLTSNAIAVQALSGRVPNGLCGLEHCLELPWHSGNSLRVLTKPVAGFRPAIQWSLSFVGEP